MHDIEYDEWMSDSDAVLWHIERDPLLRSTITTVWLLDHLPDQAHLDAVAARMLARLPRLRQRVVDDLPVVANPRWEDDPDFDLDHHFLRVRLPGRRPDLAEVLRYAQREATQAFDKARPLWELRVVEGLADRRAAVVLKVHHALADGLGLVQMLAEMVELDAGGGTVDVAPPGAAPRPAGTMAAVRPPDLRRSIAHRLSVDGRTAMRAGRAGARVIGRLATDPVGAVRDVGRTGDSVRRVVTPTPTPLSPLMIRRSLSVRLLTARVPLDEMQAAARAVEASVNDVFVAIVADAMDRYHRDMGAPCPAVRMMMPVSVRGGGDATRAGNQFVPTRVVLPLDGDGPGDRVRRIRALMRTVRAEPALPHVGDISGALGRLGPTAAVAVLGSMMKGVDITASNVPGPPFPVWIGGARVEEFYAFGPLAGAAINVTLFSYDGMVSFGVGVDAAAVAEPERFLAHLDAAASTMVSMAGEAEGLR